MTHKNHGLKNKASEKKKKNILGNKDFQFRVHDGWAPESIK